MNTNLKQKAAPGRERQGNDCLGDIQSHPHYSPFSYCVKVWLIRRLKQGALWLVDVGEMLAVLALRLECTR